MTGMNNVEVSGYENNLTNGLTAALRLVRNLRHDTVRVVLPLHRFQLLRALVVFHIDETRSRRTESKVWGERHVYFSVSHISSSTPPAGAPVSLGFIFTGRTWFRLAPSASASRIANSK